jgi:hypothetical protein
VPRDTADGVYEVKVAVRLTDRVEWLTLQYVVDTAAPQVSLQVKGRARPGSRIELVATQRITAAELKTQKGKRGPKAVIRPDIKTLHALTPDGKILSFSEDRLGRWRAAYTIPATAHGPIALKLRVVDIADNAREESAQIHVADTRVGSR